MESARRRISKLEGLLAEADAAMQEAAAMQETTSARIAELEGHMVMADAVAKKATSEAAAKQEFAAALIAELERRLLEANASSKVPVDTRSSAAPSSPRVDSSPIVIRRWSFRGDPQTEEFIEAPTPARPRTKVLRNHVSTPIVGNDVTTAHLSSTTNCCSLLFPSNGHSRWPIA